MARSKKVKEAIAEHSQPSTPDPAQYTPTSVVNNEVPQEAIADAAPSATVEHILAPPNMDIVNRALAESAKPCAPVIPGVDISAVVAKHLADSAAATVGSTKVKVCKSSVPHPVKLVHIIASELHDENPEVQRKDVIAECEKQGIATHTARTQYQIWHQAMKADAARSALQAATPPRTVSEALGRALADNTRARKQK
jgi:hypothetical protein